MRLYSPFSFETLERYLAQQGASLDVRYAHGTPRLLTDTEIARRTGLHRSAVNRCRRRGSLALLTAERVADCLGVNPSEIWTGYHDVVLLRMDRQLDEANVKLQRWREKRRAAA